MEDNYKYEAAKFRVRLGELLYIKNMKSESFNLQEVLDGIKCFEDQAMDYLENNLTAGSAKKLFFFSGLGYLLCDDGIGSLNKLNDYGYASPNLKECEEFTII